MSIKLHYLLFIFFAFFTEGYLAYTQNKPVLVEEFIFDRAPFASCHASTIAEGDNGLVVAFFGGTHEKHRDVEIWSSRKESGTWSQPLSIAEGMFNGSRYPCWNPVLFQVPEGPMLLFYKVGPDPESWWGMIKRSYNAGKSWSKPERLPDGILGPVKNKPVLLDDNHLLCPSSTENKGWKVHMEFTNDFGHSWEPNVPVDPMSKYEVIQPTILRLTNGWLQILCRSRDGLIIKSLSLDQGKSWSVLEPVDLPNPNSGIDALTLSSGIHILAYNHSKKPEDEWGGHRYPLNIAISEDGQKWSASLILEEAPGEYSYPAIIQDSKGYVHVVYTWNRKKIKHVVLDPGQLPSRSITIWDKEQ
jgi:alpha-L-rhamnosidase